MAQRILSGRHSRFIVLASICIVVGALYLAREVLVPLALALLIAFLLTPPVKWLERHGLGRVKSVLLVSFAALGVVGALGWVVGMQLVGLADDLPHYRDNIVHHVNALRGGGGISKLTHNLSELSHEISKATTAPATQAATQPANDAALDGTAAGLESRSNEPPVGTTRDRPLFATVIADAEPLWRIAARNGGSILEPLATAILVVILVIFMLMAREDLRDRVIRLVSSSQGHLTLTTQALDDAATRISRYLLAQATVNGTYGVAVAIGLWLVGLIFGHGTHFPSVVIWGLLCALFRFIPYIGPWLGAAFPLTISFAVYQSNVPFFATLGWFVLLELMAANVLEPLLYGSSTGLSPVAVLASAVFWTWLWGAIGLLLATPLTVCLVVMGKYVPQLHFLDILLGDEPVLDLPTRLYQRLLALDADEALELVEERHKEATLVQVYDEMLLPALSMAERDRHHRRLEEDRARAIRAVVKEMIAKLGDAQMARNRAADAEKTAADKVQAAAATGKAPDLEERTAAYLARLPQGCTVNVMTLPARDEADELAGLMLTQLLDLRGYCAYNVSVTALAGEMVEIAQDKQPHIVVVSALPPAAVSYSRYLIKRIRGRKLETNLIVGLWAARGDVQAARDRLSGGGALPVVTSMKDALQEVFQMAQPILVKPEATNEAAATQ